MRECPATTLVAIASREAVRAGNFIREMQLEAPWPTEPLAHGSYESLLSDERVEAVYAALPTGIRKRWVIAAAEAGKHVLCEKPCAPNAADLREMISACAANGVHFMDGVMFMHGDRFPAIMEILDEGKSLGEVRRISTSFTFRGGEGFADADIRADPALEPAGALGDLGWYCLRGILWTMGWEMPCRVSARTLARAGDRGAIMEFAGELDFPGGATASFHCSFLTPGQMWFNIGATEGSIRIPDFVLPSPDGELDWEQNQQPVPKTPGSHSCDQVKLFSRFAFDVRKDFSGPVSWAEISLRTQALQDACLFSDALRSPVVLSPDSNSHQIVPSYIQEP